MSALSNRRHELFAQALAKGETADSAYASAGYKPSRPHASRLATNGNIQARITELQERAAIKVELAAADIVEMLQEDRELARKIEQPSAAVSAALGIAKILGLITDRTELTGKNGEAVKYEDTTERATAFARLVDQLATRTQPTVQ